MKKQKLLFLVLLGVLSLLVACNQKPPLNYNLSVQIEGEGEVYPQGGSYPAGHLISFNLVPKTAWFFSHWAGQDGQQVVSQGDKYELLINKDMSLLAVFSQSPTGGNYELDVTIIGRGRVEEKLLSEVDKEASYPTLANILLTAIPEAGWSFQEWLGHASGSSAIVTLVMDSHKSVSAVFTQETRRLEIKTLGQGQVRSDNYPEPRLTGEYPLGSEVRLIAEPADGWAFEEWRGDLRGTSPQATILMDRDRSVTAVFVEHNHTLEIKVTGQGRVEKRLLSSSEEYPEGSLVRLWARAADGWVFSRWTGDLRGTNPIVQLEMDSDKSVTAIFEKASFDLDVRIIGKGRVDEKIISNEYDEGTVVRLTARANSGWEFIEWRGDARGSRESVELVMDEDKEVTAVFEEIKGFKLTVDLVGNGRVSASPDKDYYDEGEEVSLKAEADSGHRFKEWRGDASGTNPEVKLTMNRDRNVEAVFVEGPPTGTAEVSGSIKLVHNWPHPYTSGSQIVKSANLGKIPVLHSLGRENVIARKLYREGELVVGFRDTSDRITILNHTDQVSILEKAGVKPLKDRGIPELDCHIVPAPLDEEEFLTEIARLEKIEGVMYVEPNYIFYASSSVQNTKVPNDPMYRQQWHYNQIRLPHAWSVTTGSQAVRVAVLDTGVNANHTDLQGRVDTASGWNFNNNSQDTSDRDGHGTHCAGTIGAATNNGTGVAGVMWEGQIIPVKVLGDDGSGSMEDVANGMLYAAGVLSSKPISQKADVLSMSLGASQGSSTVENACRSVVNAGCLLVVAAGNSNGPIDYPGKYKEAITIGSTGYNYPNVPKRAPYSSYGAELDIMAPGGDTSADSDGDGNPDGVLSTTGSGYQFFQGTSMATPHAAGICGLMLANGIPASEVRETLRRTAMDIGGGDFSNQFGYGLTNVYWAVCNVKEIKLAVGTRNGSSLDVVAEGSVDLRAKSYSLSKIPPGEYQVFGWIDVQNTDTIDPGDYLFESNVMTFINDQKQTVNMELKEVK